MSHYLTPGQVRRIDRGLRRVEAQPLGTRYNALAGPGPTPASWFAWFCLDELLDGDHSHATAHLAAWQPEAADPTWAGAHGAYQAGGETITVRGYGVHWGLPGEWGLGRVVRSGADRTPQLEVVVNPGALAYAVALPSATVSAESIDVEVEGMTVSAFFDTRFVALGTAIEAGQPAELRYDRGTRHWRIVLPDPATGFWAEVSDVDRTAGKYTVRRLVYDAAGNLSADPASDVEAHCVTGTANGLPGVRVWVSALAWTDPETEERETRHVFRYPDGAAAKCTIAEQLEADATSTQSVALLKADGTWAATKSTQIRNLGQKRWKYDGTEIHLRYANGHWLVHSQRQARARWIRWTTSGAVADTTAEFSATVDDYFDGPDPGGTVTVANHSFALMAGASGLAIWDGVRNRYDLAIVTPVAVEPITTVGNSGDNLGVKKTKIYAVKQAAEDADYTTAIEGTTQCPQSQ